MIGEPASILWSAVKALYDSWPPDNEDNATLLSQRLRDLARNADDSGNRLHGNANAVRDAWLDEAGGVFADKIDANGADWSHCGADAARLAGIAERYAAELTRVKQTIIRVITQNEVRYDELRRHSPALAVQFAAAIAAYLRDLVGGEALASESGPGLMDRIKQAAGDAFDSAWTLTFGAGTAGPAIGASGSVLGFSVGYNVALVRDQEGNFWIVNGSSLSLTTPGLGGSAGIGVTAGFDGDNNPIRNGKDLGGESHHGGVTAAGPVGGQVSYDHDTSNGNWSSTTLAGIGTRGVDPEFGRSWNSAKPLTTANALHEGMILGYLASNNPAVFISDTLRDSYKKGN
ncbi:hypothetical protein [Amycolatopsis decaplanina]|uniref:Outer membrane channel protein CpnT-like N-terminal domain-containing protein n=1 Tax=Amycolatopsis decaplanina DSM 44594 TaxID=1284240 RepID=M2WP03_9PSEU|nr:hypothetical protein [Amycolatopsis decaplanina]EME50466.1 hypothetical protein H074_38433 [Amycolatopsis decaplanina DSM 44594]